MSPLARRECVRPTYKGVTAARGAAKSCEVDKEHAHLHVIEERMKYCMRQPLLRCLQCLTFLLVPILLPSHVVALDNPFTGNINGNVGAKFATSSVWKAQSRQTENGLEIDWRRKNWPVNLVFGIVEAKSASGKQLRNIPVVGIFNQEIEIRGETKENFIGIRKIVEGDSKCNPYFGGGIARISAKVVGMGKYPNSGWDFELPDTDGSWGYWIDGGIYWTFIKHFNLGFGGRYSHARVTLFGDTGNAGGGHLFGFAGFHW